MEAKNQEQKVIRLRRRLKYPHSFVVNPEGLSGGLALFWDDQVSISIESHSEYFINVQCFLHGNKKQEYYRESEENDLFQIFFYDQASWYSGRFDTNVG